MCPVYNEILDSYGHFTYRLLAPVLSEGQAGLKPRVSALRLGLFAYII